MSRCLDFTGSSIHQKYAKQLDEIADEVRGDFASLITQVSEPYGSSLDWWVTPLACRNTYACNLFQYLCQLILVIRVAKKDGIDQVIVDSPALAQVLEYALPNTIQVSSIVSIYQWRWLTFISALKCLVGTLYKLIARLLAAKVTAYIYRQRSKLPANPIVIIDTVMYSHSVQGDKFNDRHYPGMLDGLEDSDKKNVYWAPYYYGVRNFYGLFRKLRKSGENFILAEDYVHLSDYVYALSHFTRCVSPNLVYKFKEINVNLLVQEAYFEHLLNSSSIEALLRFRFIKRLSAAEVQVRRVIEWFENQEIDHGLIAGWRTFYPTTHIVGYQGFFASRNYLCMFPLSLEKSLKLLPHTIAVLGNDFVAPAKEFCKDLNITLAPSFRFSSIWSKRIHSPDSNYFTVFIPLPIVRSDYMSILKMVELALPSILESNQRPPRFLVKPHPAATDKDGIKKFLDSFAVGSYKLTNCDIEQAFDEADMVISSASSTCMEAVIRNIPVAIISQLGRLTQNPILQTVEKRLWAICYTQRELIDAVSANNKFVCEGSCSSVHNNFDWSSILSIKPTTESIKEFLDIPTNKNNFSKNVIGEGKQTKELPRC